MVQVSYQCLFMAFSAVLLVVHPTFELMVRNTHRQKTKRQMDMSRHAEREMQLERLAYRPNERDKAKPDFKQQESKSTNMLRQKRTAVSQRSGAIVFPDQVPETQNLKEAAANRELPFIVSNTSGPPPCARGDTFCESVDEYPAEHVMKLLRKEPVLVRGFFHDDRNEYTVIDDVQDRIDGSDENPLCPAQEHIVYPKMAKNMEGNWLFVINQDQYVQGVRVEKCVNGNECTIPGTLGNGYRALCKQKYIYRKLVALNGTGQGVISDSFQFPSCCSCVIKLDRSLAHNRFGGGGLAALPLTLPKTTPATPLKSKAKN